MKGRVQASALTAALAAVASILVGALATVAIGVYVWAVGQSLMDLLARSEVDEVLVAARDLPMGHVIEPRDLERRPLAEWMPPDDVRRDPTYLTGLTVKHRILEGDLMRMERLVFDDPNAGLSVLVPEGSRAMSINVSGKDRVEGFLEPGAHVDVLVTLWARRRRPAETVTLVRGAPVVAVDLQRQYRAVGTTRLKPQVTVIVTAEDSERLAAALRSAAPRLVLRSELDYLPQAAQDRLPNALTGPPQSRATTEGASAAVHPPHQ